MADIEARKLNDSTVRKYKLLKRQMEEFAQRRGLRVLADFDLLKLSQFRSEWKDGPRSSAKKLERLRAFFRFAQKRKWVTENPALDLKAPKITLCPPFHLAAKRWCEFSRQLTNCFRQLDLAPFDLLFWPHLLVNPLSAPGRSEALRRP